MAVYVKTIQSSEFDSEVESTRNRFCQARQRHF